MKPRGPGTRQLAAQATRDSILRAATKVFARHGYAGGRIEQISKAARSYDRMIYYYFGNKEGLFIAVIEEMYRRFNEAAGSCLMLSAEQPVESLTAMVRFMWNYYRRNPEFITLLNTENLHRGKHIAKSAGAREYSSPALAMLERVLESGVRQGLFREQLAARDLYLMIAGMGYFYLSNRYTLSAFFGADLDRDAALAHWEGFMIETVLRAVARDGVALTQDLPVEAALALG